jgi:hypothetical protein
MISAVAGGLTGVSRRQRRALVPEPLPGDRRRVPVETVP